ncbi:MAG: hypothetical protein GX493_03870 [Firmicutes bacterium]|nr:hypothetical protein [Bacillota bacterium]
MTSANQGEKQRPVRRLKALGQHFYKNPRLGIPVLVLVLALLYAVVGITNNPLRLVKMEPEGEIGVKSNLTFYFSRPVVSEEEVGRLAVSEKIVFDPPLPGKIRWEDQKTLKFFPEAPLLPSTRYSVKIAKDISTLKGVSLTGKRTLEFTTELFRIEQANLGLTYEPQTRKGLVLQGRIIFNHPVDPEELRRHLVLRFTDDGTAVGHNLRLENEGREVAITSELLQYGKNARRIEVALPEGFRCRGGKIGLRDRFVRIVDLRERRALRVADLETSTEGRTCTLIIHFSEPPDPAALENFIVLRPELDFEITVEGEKAILSADRFTTGGTYEVMIKEGLPALNGDPLPREFKKEITFPDLEPSIGFNSPGRYLSSRGHLNLGLETVNVDKVELEIAKIYANNLVTFLHRVEEDGWCYSYELPRLGRIVGSRTIEIDGGRNKVITTPINLGEFLSDQRKGLFQVTARDPEARWLTATKIAIITDLGILAKFGADDLVVWVNSLDTLAPYPGVRVSLMSYNNQEVAAGYTDENGLVTFTGIRKSLADSRPYLILAECGEDFSFVFVYLDEARIETTDFPVEGRPHLREGYEAYLYTDRGVFRPGDTANIAAIVRGAEVAVPPEFPLRLEIIGPDGMVFREYAGSTGTNGFAAFRLEIPDYAKTGRYSAVLYAAKEPIGRCTFNVEEFIPDRIKVETTTDKEEYGPGEMATIGVRGSTLFGPPAAGRRVELTVRLEPMPFSPPAYRSFSFGDATLDFHALEKNLGQDELNEEGKAAFKFTFPHDLRPPGAIRAIFQATVTEEGGRAVTNYKTVVFHPYQAYLGLKTPEEEYPTPGKDYPFRLVEVDREGRPVKGAEIEVTTYAVTWNSIYRRAEEGRYT